LSIYAAAQTRGLLHAKPASLLCFAKKNLHPESIDAKQQYLYGQRTRDTMTNANKQY